MEILFVYRWQNSVHWNKSTEAHSFSVGGVSGYCICEQGTWLKFIIYLERSFQNDKKCCDVNETDDNVY
jgi:hypothetical protein